MFMHWLGAGLMAVLLAGMSAKQGTPPKREDARVTCPYLQRQTDSKKEPKIDANTLEDDTLKQMTRLIKARKTYEEAEGLRKSGLGLDAALLYVEVQALCPGSRFEHMAATRLKEMGKAKAVVGLTPAGTLTPEVEVFLPSETIHGKIGEAEEPGALQKSLDSAPVSPGSDVICPYLRERPKQKQARPLDPSHLEEDTLKQMTSLLKARELYDEAETLLANGRLDEAEHIYQQVRELCPDTRLDLMARGCLMGIDIWRSGIMRNLLPYGFASEATPAPDHPVTPRTETTEESEPGADEEQVLVPHLPAIDPKIVDALEKVLADCSDPLPAKLVVLEVKQSAAEDQEIGASQWPTGPQPVAIPSLLVESDDFDPNVADDELEEGSEAGTMSELDLNKVLRDVIDCVRQGACVDVDGGREEGLRAQVEMRVGGVDFKLLYDDAGIQCAVVRLAPEACPDLRARQRAENDAIIGWITLLSGSGDYAAPAPTTEEDWLDFHADDDDDLGVES